MTELWTTKCYSINKLNGSLKIFLECYDFPGFPWMLWTLNKVGDASLPFFEYRKKLSDFGKKALIVHLLVKFSLQNVVLRISWRKTRKCFNVRPFFLVFLTKCLSKCPNFTKHLLPGRLMVAPLHSCINLFAKRSILNVWQCSEYVCLNNCSVVCTVTLCHVLHKSHLGF